MRRRDRRRVPLLLLACAALAAGCAAGRRSAAPPLTRDSAYFQPGAVDEARPLETEMLRALAERGRVANASPDPAARPKAYLALSGGGKFGAFTAGVLGGWSAAGDRPQFDVVTGVSTGALIATYAFLGPEYDRATAELFTSVTTRDVYRRRPVGALFWSDAAASSAPLKRLIDCHVDDDIIARVARAHAAGRRLYVGTTNLDARKFVIWDMGAIAASGRPDAKDLYRSVLLASASVPGLLPPVEIAAETPDGHITELHADGGTTAGVFLHVPSPGGAAACPPAGSSVYVIVAGKLYADPAVTDRRTVRVAESALSSVVYAQTRAELFRISSLCAYARMNFRLASLPQDFPVGADAMSFDAEELRRLYEAGYAAASGGKAWRDTPPGARPEEENRPRNGATFSAPGAQLR
jgi:predicted acylesterase/phospholipase RssA